MALIVPSDFPDQRGRDERRAHRVIGLRAEIDRLEQELAHLRERAEAARSSQVDDLHSPFAGRATVLAGRLAEELLGTGRTELAAALETARVMAEGRVAIARAGARDELTQARTELAEVLEARATAAIDCASAVAIVEGPGSFPHVVGAPAVPELPSTEPADRGERPIVREAVGPVASPVSSATRDPLSTASAAVRDADPATVYLAGLLADLDRKPGDRRWRPFDTFLPLMLAVVALALILLVIG
jgi:hypothetical protein